jgi:hypothetical protein
MGYFAFFFGFLSQPVAWLLQRSYKPPKGTTTGPPVGLSEPRLDRRRTAGKGAGRVANPVPATIYGRPTRSPTTLLSVGSLGTAEDLLNLKLNLQY